MKSPGKAACGSGFGGNPGGRCLAAGLRRDPGHGSGHRVRFSPASGKKAPPSGRCPLCASGILGVALYKLCGLPLRYPHGLYPGDAGRACPLGIYRRPVAAAGVLSFLGLYGRPFRFFADSLEKIFEICKNFVCICEKMGYNRMCKSFQISAKAEKGTPWQTRLPPANM